MTHLPILVSFLAVLLPINLGQHLPNSASLLWNIWRSSTALISRTPPPFLIQTCVILITGRSCPLNLFYKHTPFIQEIIRSLGLFLTGYTSQKIVFLVMSPWVGILPLLQWDNNTQVISHVHIYDSREFQVEAIDEKNDPALMTPLKTVSGKTTIFDRKSYESIA